MTAENGKYDPFRRPTPYEILGVAAGVHATAKEIGKAFKKQERKARHIPDLKERADRIEQLKLARDRLLRPEDRVLVDFFLLGDDLFADLCIRYGKQLASVKIPTEKIIGPLMSKHSYDDLVPASLDHFLGEIKPLENIEWYQDLETEDVRLKLVDLEL